MRVVGKVLFLLVAGFLFVEKPLAAEWYSLPFLSDVSNTDVSGTQVSGVSGADVKLAGFRFLDKQNNRTKDVLAEAGKDVAGLPITLRMKRCVKDVGGVVGQDMAWIDVTDPTARGAVLFSGWMINLYPDMATMENPRFDVRLVGCARPKGSVKASGSGAPSIRVDGPAPDDEAPASVAPVKDSEAPAADDSAVSNGSETPVKTAPAADKDPYYVPGVGSDGNGKTKISEPKASGGEDQKDLQKMMDEGTY